MAPRLLVTGANGQLGRELLRRGAPRGFAVVGRGRSELDITDGDGRGPGDRRVRRRPCGQCRGLHRRRPGGERAGQRLRRQRRSPAPARQGLRCPWLAADPRLHRLRLRRRQGARLCRGRPGGAAGRLRRQQGGGRAGDPRGVAGARHPAHGLGLQRAQPQFRPDHAAARGQAGRAARGRRPARLADRRRRSRRGDP